MTNGQAMPAEDKYASKVDVATRAVPWIRRVWLMNGHKIIPGTLGND